MEHLFKGYAIAKIEYGGWGDSHPVVKGTLYKIFPKRDDAANKANQNGYNLYNNDFIEGMECIGVIKMTVIVIFFRLLL